MYFCASLRVPVARTFHFHVEPCENEVWTRIGCGFDGRAQFGHQRTHTQARRGTNSRTQLCARMTSPNPCEIGTETVFGQRSESKHQHVLMKTMKGEHKS